MTLEALHFRKKTGFQKILTPKMEGISRQLDLILLGQATNCVSADG